MDASGESDWLAYVSDGEAEDVVEDFFSGEDSSDAILSNQGTSNESNGCGTADEQPSSAASPREGFQPSDAKDTSLLSSGILSRIALNSNKAGLAMVDKEHINRVIFETSKDSKYFLNELKKDRQVQERVVCLGSPGRGVVRWREILRRMTRRKSLWSSMDSCGTAGS